MPQPLRTAVAALAWIAATLGVMEQNAIAAASRIDGIRARGHLTCGVVARVPGFTSFDKNGNASGFEPDLCRAVAAAIFGLPDKVIFIPAVSVDQFREDHSLDVVARRLTLTLQRDAAKGVTFGPVMFYDGAALMVPATSGISDIAALAGKQICLRKNSEAAEALARAFALRGWAYTAVPYATIAETTAAFFANACAAVVADISELGAARAGHLPDTVILAPTLSKEPLALFLRDNDQQFLRVVRWTMHALIAGEELGVTSANVDVQSTDPDARRLVGDMPGNGKLLGLDERWAAHVIKGVGNYGEIFARNLGADSPYKMERGVNALWTNGGLLYAPPLR